MAIRVVSAEIKRIEAPCSAGRDSTFTIDELRSVRPGLIRLHMEYGGGHVGVSFLTPDEAIELAGALEDFAKQVRGEG